MRFEFGEFVLDESAFELRRAGELLKVDPKVLDVLAYLVRRPGQLVTKHELVNHVWGGRTLSDTVLTGAISRLRRALGNGNGVEDGLLENVYGRGYRFAGVVRQRDTSVPAPDTATTNAARASSDSRFVGRNAAMARVQAALGQARNGRGRIVVVVGEPGIGKTHLAEVSTEGAADLGFASAWGHCRALEVGPPFWPFIELLRASRRASASAGTRELIDSTLATLIPEGDAALDWGLEASVHRVFDAFTRTLQALTDDQPWLWVLDDLQWADAVSLRLLAYLTPEIARMRLVILATARNTEPQMGDGRLAQVLGHRNSIHIELDRLTEADVAEYTALCLGKAESEVSRAVFAKSEGNPFFMVELLRPFDPSTPPRVDELALPGPALDIVRQRVRILSKETVALLSVAAIVGRDFDLGLLGQVTQRTPEALLDILQGARDSRTILESSHGPGHFAFGHDLIRSVLLEGLSATEAAQLHARVAEALERRYPVGGGLPRPEIVHHLLSAVPLGDVAKAIDYARRSALGAAQVCAHADASALLRRALAALELSGDPPPRQRCDLLFGLALCERRSMDGRFSEHLWEAVAIGREHGLGSVLAEAARHLTHAPGAPAIKGAREVLEAAGQALPQDSKALRAEVLARLSWTPPYCFDKEKVDSLIVRAEALARECNSSAVLATVLTAKRYFASGPGSHELAQKISDEIDRLYAEREHLVPSAWPAHFQMSNIVVSQQRADMDGVSRYTAAVGASAREFKLAELDWHYRRACVVHQMNRGEYDDVQGRLRELQDQAERMQLFARRTICATDWGVLLRETGDVAFLAPHAEAMVPGDADCPYRWARKVRFLLEMGLAERARTALVDLPAENLDKLPHDRDYLGTLVHLAVCSIGTRSTSHAEALYALLSPYSKFHAADLSFHCDGSVAHFLGTLARALGRRKEAADHLEEALTRNEEAGFAPRTAHSAFQLASVLADSATSQGVKRARTLLTRVLEATRRMGMGPLTRRAEELLRSS